MSQGRRGRWWLTSGLIAAGIWVVSGMSDTPGPGLAHPWDWAAHGVTYLALAFSLTRATGSAGAALALAAWYGALDEVHQSFVPGREAGLPDWLADVTGAWLGVTLAGWRCGPAPQSAPQE